MKFGGRTYDCVFFGRILIIAAVIIEFTIMALNASCVLRASALKQLRC